jgi:hypothetical protein
MTRSFAAAVAFVIAILLPATALGQSPSPSVEPTSARGTQPTTEAPRAEVCLAAAPLEPETVGAAFEGLVADLQKATKTTADTFPTQTGDSAAESSAADELAAAARDFVKGVKRLDLPVEAQPAAQEVIATVQAKYGLLVRLLREDQRPWVFAEKLSMLADPGIDEAVGNARTVLGIDSGCAAPGVMGDPLVGLLFGPSPEPKSDASRFVARTAEDAIFTTKHKDVSYQKLRHLTLKVYDAVPQKGKVGRFTPKELDEALLRAKQVDTAPYKKLGISLDQKTRRNLRMGGITGLVLYGYTQYVKTKDQRYLDVARHAFWYGETEFGRTAFRRFADWMRGLQPDYVDASWLVPGKAGSPIDVSFG